MPGPAIRTPREYAALFDPARPEQTAHQIWHRLLADGHSFERCLTLWRSIAAIHTELRADGFERMAESLAPKEYEALLREQRRRRRG